MKINHVKLENFMLFNKLEADFSPNINILIGENSTGKTTLLKALYVGAKACRKAQTLQEDTPSAFADDIRRRMEETGKPVLKPPVYWRDFLTLLLNGVYCPANDDLDRLVNYNQNGAALLSVEFGQGADLWFQFGNDKASRNEVPRLPPRDFGNIVYIPTGEMISHTESFASLYEEYRIPFDETCYALVRLLDRPKKRKLPEALQSVVNALEKTIGGKVVQKGRVFYLDVEGVGKVEMSLVSEGYRKLATLLALLESGALSDGSILFWDEPETNMNPQMMQTVVNALIAVAGAGVQVFVTTHDYFVQQYFGLAATYKEKYGEDAGKLDFRFFSLYRESAEGAGKPDSTVLIESAARLVDLEHNAVTEEEDVLGDKEMRLFYGDDA